MGIVDVILNLAGLLLWVNWVMMSASPTTGTPLTLLGTLRPAERSLWRQGYFLALLPLLLTVRAWLYWEVLKYSIEQGCTTFDFGRSSKDSNTYRFKKQWGAEAQQLHWYNWVPSGQSTPKLDPSNSKYTRAIEMWRKLPLPVANLLGPHIVRSLP